MLNNSETLKLNTYCRKEIGMLFTAAGANDLGSIKIEEAVVSAVGAATASG